MRESRSSKVDVSVGVGARGARRSARSVNQGRERDRFKPASELLAQALSARALPALSRGSAETRAAQIDDETWRLLLRRTSDSLSKYHDRIHPAYLTGFELLFGDSEQIPNVHELNAKLEPFGWKTMLVDGYLRHDAYATLLTARVFPVARRIRRRCDIDHSPVPDLAHDVIGHLPMLADVEHREFLQRVGQVMSRVKLSALDRRLYLAQRRAGHLRESEPSPSPAAVRRADAAIQRIEVELERHPTAIGRLSRLYLWTIEFGLLGSCDAWVAYGAALISSGKELEQLMSGRPPILPLSADAMSRGISFCDPQHAYYLAPNHNEAHRLLDVLLKQADPRRDR